MTSELGQSQGFWGAEPGAYSPHSPLSVTQSPVSLFLLCLVRAFKKKTASSCEQPAWVMPAHPLRWLSPTRPASHGQRSFQAPKEWTQSNPKNQTKWEHGNWILGQATGGGSLLRLSGLQIITPRPTHWRSTCFVWLMYKPRPSTEPISTVMPFPSVNILQSAILFNNSSYVTF